MATCRACPGLDPGTPRARLRHNRGMSPILSARALPACAWLLSAALAGCGGPSSTNPQATTGLPQLDGGDGRIEWHGELACADCDAIDTRLVLQRGGEVRDYTLTETYLAADDSARFVEHGRWQRDDALLQLLGDGGGMRVYALLPDGRLQPRDGRGRRFPQREDDFLVPVTVASAP